MKVTNYHNASYPSVDLDIESTLPLQIHDLTEKCHQQLTKGWCVMIRIRTPHKSEASNLFTFDATSDHGGGEYAATKLAMLESFPELSHTGEENAVKFAELLDKKFAPDPEIQRICTKLKDAGTTALVSTDIWEELRHKYRVTHWYGGIRIPMSVTRIVETENQQKLDSQTTTYETLISFSGAKQWMDTYLALQFFRSLAISLSQTISHASIEHNLNHLRKDPAINFHLINMGI